MKIAIERVDFHNEQIHAVGEGFVKFVPCSVNVEYTVKVKGGQMRGEMNIPFDAYENLTYKGLIELIEQASEDAFKKTTRP